MCVYEGWCLRACLGDIPPGGGRLLSEINGGSIAQGEGSGEPG